MPTVSILIPAYSAKYLKHTLESAIDQSFDDLEILVGDDSKTGELESLVKSFNHPKVHYFHHGFGDAVKNTQALWERASGQYVKWLYHDDVLLRHSVASLVDALRQYPDAVFAFHERVFINEHSDVQPLPPRLLDDGKVALLDREFLVQKMIATTYNFIGEPSNILVDKTKIDITRRQTYKNWRLQFLTDVAGYLEMADRHPAVLVGGYMSCFRQHGGQASNPQSAFFSAGVFEWELMLRHEATRGTISREAMAEAQARLRAMYSAHVGRLPELRGFLDALPELTDLPFDQLATSPRFVSAFENARALVAQRIEARKQGTPGIATAPAQPAPAVPPAKVPATSSPSVTDAALAAVRSLITGTPVAAPQAAPIHAPSGPTLSIATPQNRPPAQPTAAPLAPASTLPCVCAVCGQKIAQWIPHPRVNNRSPFMMLMQAIGSKLERYQCPSCSCNDRDRHLWLYMKAAGLLQDLRGKRILHIAPETTLEPRLRAMEPLEYIGGDLFPKTARHQKVNVQALQFPDAHFDLIICNHVLEHVDDPTQALREFRRCLTPTGHLVAQTPYSPLLKHTFEVNIPVAPDFSTLYYGQDDHVRLFGADIVKYFREAGLHGDLIPHDEALAGYDAQVWGVNEREPFFHFTKVSADALVD